MNLYYVRLLKKCISSTEITDILVLGATMPKRRPASYVQQVKNRMRPKEPTKTKRTLVLTTATYDIFEKVCRKNKTYPSFVIDEFIHAFVEAEK